MTFSFDYQRKLISPRSNSIVFGERLSTSNLTVVDENTGEAVCYLFEAFNGRQAGAESASILFKLISEYIPNKYPNAEFIRLWSDNGSHFKNLSVVNGLMWSLKHLRNEQKLANLRSICHRFLITGHTQFGPDTVMFTTMT